jgi:hypothetical protein
MELEGEKFMVRRNGLLWFSTLAIVLILVAGVLQDSDWRVAGLYRAYPDDCRDFVVENR